jgi:hypothetical protein
MTKTDELISKLEEALQLSKECINLFIDRETKGINSRIVKINKLKSAISQLKEQIKKEDQWTTDKIIDFVNWYLRLCKVITDKDCRFELENQSVIDSFLNGYDYKLWWNKANSPKRRIRNQKTYDFVVKYKILIYQNTRHYNNYVEGKNDKYLQELIELARKEIGYSDKTWSGDIFTSIVNLYKKICV